MPVPAQASARRQGMLEVKEKTSLRRGRPLGGQASRAANQGVESSFCCWIAGWRLAEKECSFHTRDLIQCPYRITSTMSDSLLAVYIYIYIYIYVRIYIYIYIHLARMHDTLRWRAPSLRLRVGASRRYRYIL